MAETLFYLLAAGAVGFGAGVIAAKNPLFSVLSLLGTFFCLAGVYLLAGFQFLAATQLLVYAGAIMVLFLFVIMLLNLGEESELEKHSGIALGGGRLGIAAGAAVVLVLIGIFSIGWGHGSAAEGATEATTMTIPTGGYDALSPVEDGEGGIERQGLASVLFSRYMLPFEAASLLLLATMVAVIALAKRQRAGQLAVEERMGWPWEKGVEQ